MNNYQPYLSFIDSQSEHMKQLVYDWSAINSGSYNVDGLAKMLGVLRDNFYWLEGTMEELPLAIMQQVGSNGELFDVPLGRALSIRKRPDAPIQVFLGGHYDTVFAENHPFQKPYLIDENTMGGPGVADLKGGLVVMLKALEALEKSPYAANIGWEILLNPDEEIGSIGSDYLLKIAAERNHIGLIYEPSLPDGTLVGERKGSGNFSYVVRGRAAHAGREHHLGRNAIIKAAEIALELDGLNGVRDGLTINVAKIEGGGALNVVPDLAILRFNIRVVDYAQQEFISEKLAQIQSKFSHDDYNVKLHGKFTRPAKKLDARAEKLWEALRSSGEMLGIAINHKPSGGCCDGNNMASYGLPNIDTLGVRGGAIHSDGEYMIIDSLVERAKLSACLLMRLASGEIALNY